MTSPTARPAITGSTPDSNSATQTATAEDHGRGRTPLGGRVAQRDQRAEQRDGQGQRHQLDVVAVDGGDDQQGHQVVDDHDRQEPHAQPLRTAGHERQHAEREGRVGRHRGAPAVRPAPPALNAR